MRAGVPEWPKGSGLGPDGLVLRGFESHPPHQSATNGSLEDFEEYLRTRLTCKGTNLAESTIESRLRIIRTLRRRVNLWDVDEVQKLIDSSHWSNGRKEQVSLAYWDWCAFKGFEFKKKKYPRQYMIPYIPTEEEIDQLIGGFINSPYAPFL